MVQPLKGVNSLGSLLDARAVRGNEGNGSDIPSPVRKFQKGTRRSLNMAGRNRLCPRAIGVLGFAWALWGATPTGHFTSVVTTGSGPRATENPEVRGHPPSDWRPEELGARRAAQS